MFTAGSVIEGARDTHATFDALSHPTGIARRQLGRYVRELRGRVAQIDETAGLTEEVVPIAALTAPGGYPLSARRSIVGLTVVGTDGTERDIPIVSHAARDDRNTPRAAGWLLDNVLFLRSSTTLWRSAATVRIKGVEEVRDILSDALPIPLPDACENACVASVALYFARRAKSLGVAIDTGEFAAELERAETLALQQVGEASGGTHFRVRDVWP